MGTYEISQGGCVEWGEKVPNPREYRLLKREQKKLFMQETEK